MVDLVVSIALFHWTLLTLTDIIRFHIYYNSFLMNSICIGLSQKIGVILYKMNESSNYGNLREVIKNLEKFKSSNNKTLIKKKLSTNALDLFWWIFMKFSSILTVQWNFSSYTNIYIYFESTGPIEIFSRALFNIIMIIAIEYVNYT